MTNREAKMTTRSLTIRTIALGVLLLLVIAGVACTGSATGDPAQDSGAGAGVSWRVPSESLSDWTAYAEQISIITILSNEQQPLDASTSGRNEGSVDGIMTVRVDETLWVMPGVEPTTRDITFQSFGWALHEGKLTPFNPDAEVGAQYLVAFGRFEPGLSPIRPPTIRVVGGRLEMGNSSRGFSLAWMEEYAGKTVAEMRAVLEATPAD